MSGAIYIVALKDTYTDITPTMTSDTTPAGYVVSASSGYSAAVPAWHAFNGIDGDSTGYNVWHSTGGMPQWLMMKFPNPQVVRRFSVRNCGHSHKGINEFILQGSNDGEAFDDLGTYFNPAELGALTEYEVNTPGAYSYYRLYITSSHYGAGGTYYAVIDQVRFYAVGGSANVTQKASKLYAVIGGVARAIKKGYAVVDGITRLFYKGLDSVLNNNTWEQIAQASADGVASSIWKVGDTKTETLNGISYTFRIIDFDHDNLNSADAKYGDPSYNSGKKKAGITFEMAAIFSTGYGMNTSQTNVGGWNGSNMRNSVMSMMKGYMSTDLKNVLRTVSKLTSSGNSSSTIVTSADQLFLLSYIEVKGTNTSYAGEGSQYRYYKAGNKAIKKKDNTASTWWTRSPHSGNTSFYAIEGTGAGSGNPAHIQYGVSFGFCV